MASQYTSGYKSQMVSSLVKSGLSREAAVAAVGKYASKPSFSGIVQESGGGQSSATSVLYQGSPVAKISGTSATYSGTGATYGLTFSSGEKIIVSPQQLSIQQQEQQKNLMQQNVTTQRDALQRDQNYALTTQVQPLSWWDKANQAVAKYTTQPVYNLLGSVGFDLTSPALYSGFTPSLIGVGPFGFNPEVNKQVYGGFQAGINLKMKNEPLTLAAEVGAGYAGGLLFEGLSIGAATLSPALGVGTKVLGFGAGAVSTGLYGYSKAMEISAEPDYTKKGMIAGKAFVDTSAIGLGFAGGMKGAQQLGGLFATKGRMEIPFEKLTQSEVLAGERTFPEIPKGAQLKTFQTGTFKEFVQPLEITGGKQGAFHTTSFRFYDSIINPKSGTSELEGLYGSPYISPNFAKISGSGDIGFLTNLKTLFEPSGKPGVAFLKPAGFRISPFELSSSPLFEGQKSVAGKFASFIKSPEMGIADIPLMKTEAEAVFRPGAGSYLFESGKYYTKINKVRLPIDVFSYSYGGKGGQGGTLLKPTLAKANVRETFGSMSLSRGGYNLPKEFDYSFSSNLISLPFISSSVSSKNRYNPLSYSPKSSDFSIPSSPLSKSNFSYPSQPSRWSSSIPSIPSYPSIKSFKPITSFSSSSSNPFTTIFPGYSDKSLGGWAIPKKRKRGKKSPFDIAPGFTDIILNIETKSPIKVSKTWGVTAFQLRPILVGKKRKGKYFTLTDL